MEWYEYLITTGVPTAAVAIVGFVLIRQIKSQNEIIKNYESYIKTTDWKAVKEHYEEIKIPHAIELAVEKTKKEIDEIIDKELDPQLTKMTQELTELVTFSAHVLAHYFPKEQGQDLMRAKMPNCEHIFEAIWAWHDEQRAALQKTQEV